MRVSEILRQLADLVDQTETVAGQEVPGEAGEPCDQSDEMGADVTVTHLEPVDVDSTDGSEPATMISPLQQEHELLKKSQGVNNNVDEFAGDEDPHMEPQLEPDEKMVPTTEEQPWASEKPEEEVEEADQGYNSELAAMKKSAGIGEEQKGQDTKEDQLNPRRNAAQAFHNSRKAGSE